MKTKTYVLIAATALGGLLTSCNDFLDSEPKSNIAPEMYFSDVSHLLAYADKMYPEILPGTGSNTYGFYAADEGTDNQINGSKAIPSRYYPEDYKVPLSNSTWSFAKIYNCNYFFSEVLPRFGDDLSGAQNTITGNLATVRHHIGEMYVLRALEYFSKYQSFGDFPIITEPLPDNKEALTEASKRAPRNEVARFILSDLDKAATLMDGVNLTTTRINRDVALLIKSRVALYEGTWLKYFKGTAFVPNGEGWPGKDKDYNANYQFSGGSIDNEINWFLEQAMAAAKEVADKYKGQLTLNTGVLQQSSGDPANPYYDMFAAENMGNIPEVLLWRQYALGLETHDLALAANQGNWSVGVTRSYVQNFLMADGLPVYAHGAYADGDGYYMGDKTIADVRANRDSRLSLFLKEPGQKNILIDGSSNLSTLKRVEPYPGIITSSDQERYPTGYALRKGGNFDVKYYSDMGAGYTGLAIYRAAEALLNYMEASYERNGSLDASAREYWKLLRTRANVSDDIDATIAATDMSKEAENDWAAHSAGNLLTDKTLYNIRRERRSEFITEGIRYMDLRRWRAMDQMLTKPYIPEGFHLWNTPMESWYTGLAPNVNVSPSTSSEYIRPFQITTDMKGYEGFRWKMAHYLEPVMIKQFLLTSPDGKTVANSVLYQNPYWPLQADMPATN